MQKCSKALQEQKLILADHIIPMDIHTSTTTAIVTTTDMDTDMETINGRAMNTSKDQACESPLIALAWGSLIDR